MTDVLPFLFHSGPVQRLTVCEGFSALYAPSGWEHLGMLDDTCSAGTLLTSALSTSSFSGATRITAKTEWNGPFHHPAASRMHRCDSFCIQMACVPSAVVFLAEFCQSQVDISLMTGSLPRQGRPPLWTCHLQNHPSKLDKYPYGIHGNYPKWLLKHQTTPRVKPQESSRGWRSRASAQRMGRLTYCCAGSVLLERLRRAKIAMCFRIPDGSFQTAISPPESMLVDEKNNFHYLSLYNFYCMPLPLIF